MNKNGYEVIKARSALDEIERLPAAYRVLAPGDPRLYEGPRYATWAEAQAAADELNARD